MADALLHGASSASDLLPDNTEIFASTVRFPRLFYLAGGTALILFVSLFLAGASAVNQGSKAGLISAAFVTFAIAGLGLFLWRRQLERLYYAALSQGNWHQGIIVFPSGDIVVRYSRMVGFRDLTIESAFLSRVEVERGCAPLVCGIRPYLRLHYIGVDGRGQVISIGQPDLADPVQVVADFIADLKSKSMAF